MLCVYSVELPHWVDSNEYTENTIILYKSKKTFQNHILLMSWAGAMFNPQWFELHMPETNFHGSKDVWIIED